MKLRRRVLALPGLLGALAVLLLAVQVNPAGAAPYAGVATVVGQGTITPALSVTQTPRSHAFTFTSTTITLTGVANGAPAVLSPSSCNASGSSVSEVYAGGAGTGGWACSTGALAGRSGSLTYARVGAVVPVVIQGGITAALVCAFQPDQAPPSNVSSYHLTCAGGGGSAS